MNGSIRRGARLCTVIGLVAGCMALAGSPGAQTFEEALVMAYEGNPDLQAARAALRTTNERIAQADGAWRPTVSSLFQAGATYTHGENRANRLKTRSYPVLGQLRVDQTIYDGGRRTARERVAINEIQAERARLGAAEQQVLLDASAAYVNVLRDESVLALRINNLERLEKQLQATRDRFAVGEVTRTDVAQAESRVARAQADRTRAEGDLVSAHMVFERVMGELPGTLTQPDLPASWIPGNQEEAVATALEGNFSLITTKFQARAANEQVADIEAELLPAASLSATAQRAQNTNGTSDNSFNTAALQLDLRVPIYRGGVVYSQVRAAKEEANRRRIIVESYRRSVIEGSARAYENLTTSIARTDSLVKEEESARIALEGVEQEATVGARTVLDVLDAEQALLDAQVRRVQSERNAFIAALQLQFAMGRLTAQALNLPVTLYDVDRHFLDVRGRYLGTGLSPD